MTVVFRRSLRSMILFLATASYALTAQTFVPGQSYFGRNNYIEYIAGNAPFIISAPHGGSLEPAEIPDRTVGTTTKDSNTEELIRAVQAAYYAQTGLYPHVIINRLHRKKLDANREVGEAAAGNTYAIQAWNEFQTFIDTAKAIVTRSYGKGFYIDLHGHGHAIQRLELGYLLTADQLDLSDATLNGNTGYRNITGIRAMATAAGIPFASLLRGETSFGSFLQYRGYPSVPSSMDPTPGDATYFNGGYNTDRHGSNSGGTINGLQIECNYDGVRDSDANRKKFAAVLTDVIQRYTALYLFKTVTNSNPAVSLNEVLFDIPTDNAGTPALEGDANGDGVRSARGDEFVEIVNRDASDVNIGGWNLLEKDLNKIFTFPAGTVLKAGEAAVVFGGVAASGFGSQLPVAAKYFAAKPGLADSGFTVSASKTNFLGAGDNVILYDPSVNYVADEIFWGTAAARTKNGKKLIAPNTVAGDSIAGAIQQSVTRNPAGTGLWTLHQSVSSAPYSPGRASAPNSVRPEQTMPAAFSLGQNFPNPFNPSTVIPFSLPSAAPVTLTVTDLLGRTVRVSELGVHRAGTGEVRFDAAGLSSGTYFYTVRAGMFTGTKRMTIVR